MKIIKVIWRDAQTIHRTLSLEEIKETQLVPAHTIGYLVDENKDRIAVCGFYLKADGKEDLEDGHRDTHFIPKKWIKKIIELKEVK